MQKNKFLAIILFSLLLLSFAYSADSGVTVTDSTQQNTLIINQLNAKVQSLTTQITSLQDAIKKNHDEAMKVSDLPAMYQQIANENRAFEVNVLTDNIIIAVLCFALIFILIAKRMFPAYRRTKRETQIFEEMKTLLQPKEPTPPTLPLKKDLEEDKNLKRSYQPTPRQYNEASHLLDKITKDKRKVLAKEIIEHLAENKDLESNIIAQTKPEPETKVI